MNHERSHLAQTFHPCNIFLTSFWEEPAIANSNCNRSVWVTSILQTGRTHSPLTLTGTSNFPVIWVTYSICQGIWHPGKYSSVSAGKKQSFYLSWVEDGGRATLLPCDSRRIKSRVSMVDQSKGPPSSASSCPQESSRWLWEVHKRSQVSLLLVA